jgi:hypothetical protein
MKAIFGVVGLLVALAIVGILAKKQLSAARGPAPADGEPPAATVREQSQQTQERVRQDVQRALDMGAARSSDATP